MTRQTRPQDVTCLERDRGQTWRNLAWQEFLSSRERNRPSAIVMLSNRRQCVEGFVCATDCIEPNNIFCRPKRHDTPTFPIRFFIQFRLSVGASGGPGARLICSFVRPPGGRRRCADAGRAARLSSLSPPRRAPLPGTAPALSAQRSMNTNSALQSTLECVFF